MTIDCMTGYAGMLVQKLNDTDEVQLGGGVIKGGPAVYPSPLQ